MSSCIDESSPYTRAVGNLASLGMEEMATRFGAYAAAVASGEKDFTTAMLEMTEAEIGLKARLFTDQQMQRAGFPFVKTLADFDWAFQPSVPRGVVEDLATLRFLEDGHNVVLVGNPGVGKTHIAVAIGVEAVKARKQVRFMDCAKLVEDLKAAARRDALESKLKYYAQCSLLIIDELGYLVVDKDGADLLFQLISRRYERRSTIITTNVGVGGWAEVLGDPVTASAMADRVCHHCTVIKITGRSYRTKDILKDLDGSNDSDGAPS